MLSCLGCSTLESVSTRSSTSSKVDNETIRMISHVNDMKYKPGNLVVQMKGMQCIRSYYLCNERNPDLAIQHNILELMKTNLTKYKHVEAQIAALEIVEVLVDDYPHFYDEYIEKDLVQLILESMKAHQTVPRIQVLTSRIACRIPICSSSELMEFRDPFVETMLVTSTIPNVYLDVLSDIPYWFGETLRKFCMGKGMTSSMAKEVCRTALNMVRRFEDKENYVNMQMSLAATTLNIISVDSNFDFTEEDMKLIGDIKDKYDSNPAIKSSCLVLQEYAHNKPFLEDIKEAIPIAAAV